MAKFPDMLADYITVVKSNPWLLILVVVGAAIAGLCVAENVARIWKRQ